MLTESDTNSSKISQILLIDDEPSVLFALKLLLDALGYSVTDFNKPQEALDYLSAGNTCDLCICDLKMPKLNGLQVLAEAIKLVPTISFVLMSAHANNDEIARATQLGAKGFLAKPFSPEQLKEIVGKIDAS